MTTSSFALDAVVADTSRRKVRLGPRAMYVCFLAAFLLYQSCSTMHLLAPITACNNDNNKASKHEDKFQFGTNFANEPEDVDIRNAFDWSQVKLTEKGNCGMTKCFFDAAHNGPGSKLQDSSSSPNVGYLVANQNKYEKMRKVATMAEWMQQEMGAKHFNADLPFLVNVTVNQIIRLNELVNQPLREITNMSTKDIFLPDDRSVVVQKVIKAPVPTVTFGRRVTKMGSLPTVLPDFCVHVPDREALAAQLEQERRVLWRALLRVPALWRDLQGMVDVHGNFYFIDLDAAVSKRAVAEEKRMEYVINCMDMYDSFVRQVLECIDEKKWLQPRESVKLPVEVVAQVTG